MSLGVPQFDPEFQTQLFLRFSPCRFDPHRFPVKMAHPPLHAPPFVHSEQDCKRLLIDSRSKWKLFPQCSWCLCCRHGKPGLMQNFQPNVSHVFHHADSTQLNSRSKWKLFCALRCVPAWAKLLLASQAQGHSSQIWVCHRGYPSFTQNFTANLCYVFHHADFTEIDSRSKWKFFCSPCGAHTWAK